MTSQASDELDSQTWPYTVAVLGAAGLIGSGIAAQLAFRSMCQVIWMVDVRQNVARAHAIDIAEAQAAGGAATTRLEVVSAQAVEPVDLVIVAASAPETPNGSRNDFLAANLEVLTSLVPDIVHLAGDSGIVLLVSNPVDILAGSLSRLTGLAPGRVIGYSLNDSVRLQVALARELRVDPSRVTSWVLGEHGSGQVPVFSRVLLDGAPLAISQEARGRVKIDIDGWFVRWSKLKPGRSSGWTTPTGVIATIRAVASGTTLPASVWTGSIASLDNCFVTLPAMFNRLGLVGIDDWELDEEEVLGVRTAASSVRKTTDEVLLGIEAPSPPV